jgi:hypothetical protein
LNLLSLSGDIALNNNISLIEKQILTCSDQGCTTNTYSSSIFRSVSQQIESLLAMYPGNLNAYALSGNLQINNNMSLYPAANSSFNLVAEENIVLGANVIFSQLDFNPANLLAVDHPNTGAGASTSITKNNAYWVSSTSYDNVYAHAALPVHNADTTHNQIISAQGSIIGTDNGNLIIAAKATDISAAQNFTDINLSIQDLNSAFQDISTLSVGALLSYTAIPNATTGSFSSSQSIGIQVAGPGWLNVWAGSGVNLGVSNGFTTVGALYNTALPSSGASITVLAGELATQESAPITNFLTDYVFNTVYIDTLLQAQNAKNNSILTSDLNYLLNTINNAQFNLTQANTPNNQLQTVLSVLFAQLSLAAAEENSGQGNAAYQAGYTAINELFPSATSANITMSFSEIQTLKGGNINLLAPNGSVNVGLDSSDLSIVKNAADLGIVAQGWGNVNILAADNVEVNQNRIFTLDAGNITVWSENGNIDAGRGAKSAFATALPIAEYDDYGNLILSYPATVSDSGIRAQSGYNSNATGNVSLIAPRGVVNASEAGIGGNNITIAATAVIGASNIQALGSSLGVPSAVSTISTPDVGGSALAGLTKQASINLYAVNNALDKEQAKASKVAIFDTQIVGFGSCSVADIRNGVLGCSGK